MYELRELYESRELCELQEFLNRHDNYDPTCFIFYANELICFVYLATFALFT